MATTTVAFLLSLAAAAATLLGWVAVAAKRTWTPRSVGTALLLSATAMLVISLIELLPPGIRDVPTRGTTVVMFSVGVVAVPLLGLALTRLVPTLGALEGASLLVMVAIALHNIPEGTVAFAATLIDLRTGLVTALAIGLHNIPEGMAVSSAVIAAGGTRRRALALTSVSMLGEVLGAVLILALGTSLHASSAAAVMALVGGIMVSLSVFELIPAGVRLVRGATAPAAPGVPCPPRADAAG